MSYREDFIKRLISQFFDALYKIFGVVKKEDYAHAQELISQLRGELLGLSDQLAASLDAPDLIRMLSTGDEPEPVKPLILAELFKAEAEIKAAQEDEDQSYSLYLKALDLLLEFAYQTNETHFPEEFTTIESIAALLEDYVLPPDTLAALFNYYEAAGQYAHAEETLFDFIEDSPNPKEILAVGFRFVERLRQLSEEQLAAGELTPSDLDDVQTELLNIQASRGK